MHADIDMREELDYLEETIPHLPDKSLIDILAVNTTAYSQLAVDFAVEELGTRGFKVEQADSGFVLETPAGERMSLPRGAETHDDGGYAHPGLPTLAAGMPRQRDLVGVGGWLGLLVFDLTILGPLFFLFMLYTLGLGLGLIRQYPALGMVTVLDRLCGVVISSAGFYAGLKLYRVRPGAVSLAKRFLILSAVCVTVVSSLVYVTAVSTRVPAIKANAGMIPVMVLSSWVGCGVWYMYLSRSKRVAATYGLAAAERANIEAGA